MKLALMQPYLFPYLGYFQLISSVDLFVLYDDAQFISDGWVARNRIAIGGKLFYLSLPIRKDCHTKLINQRVIAQHLYGKARQRIAGQLYSGYRRAPYYSRTMELLDSILDQEPLDLVGYICGSIVKICRHLGIKTQISLSSEIAGGRSDAAGVDYVYKICSTTGASCYVNSSGGISLYNRELFAARGIELKFIEMTCRSLRTGTTPPNYRLSIVDVLMWNDLDLIAQCIDEYELV